MNPQHYWRFALGPTQTADLVNNVEDSPKASRTHSFPTRSRTGALRLTSRRFSLEPKTSAGRWGMRGCLAARRRSTAALRLCAHHRAYMVLFIKYIFFTRSGTAGGVERALKETCRVEASIFARRLKLLNLLPSFTANFAPARKNLKKLEVAEGRLGARTPTRTAHCHRQPHGQPHGRQTLKRTKV